MDIILLENLTNLGKIGDKVTVKDGYGRNYLLKHGKALRFNKNNEQLIIKQKAELNKKNIEQKNKFLQISKKVNNLTIVFNKESKENGDLYGTIKPKEMGGHIFSPFLFKKRGHWHYFKSPIVFNEL